MKPIFMLTGTLMALSVPASANEFVPAMQNYLETELMNLVQDQVVVDAILAQNAQTSGYSEAEIIALDNAWRAEVGTGSTPTIDPVLSNSAAEFLRTHVDASAGVLTEVFIMDSVGLNVAASAVTSDMWQGDEDKFQKTYGQGPGTVHFGEVEFDESTQTYQGQVSVTITDPSSGEPIGAVTFGLNADALL